jgi:hypothetical protein
MVVSESFLHRAHVVERRGQGENAGRSYPSAANGRSLSHIERVEALGEETKQEMSA